jgi:hypothetical protein
VLSVLSTLACNKLEEVKTFTHFHA